MFLLCKVSWRKRSRLLYARIFRHGKKQACECIPRNTGTRTIYTCVRAICFVGVERGTRVRVRRKHFIFSIKPIETKSTPAATEQAAEQDRKRAEATKLAEAKKVEERATNAACAKHAENGAAPNKLAWAA